MSRIRILHEGLTPDLVKKAEIELGETEEVKANTLEELKNVINTEPDFYPCTEDWFLLRFLRMKKFNVDRAFDMLKRYYKFRAKHSEMVKKPSEVLHVLEEGHITLAEYIDDTYGTIAIMRPSYYDVDKVNVDDLLALGFVIFEIGLMSEAAQIMGYSVIDDLSDITFGQIKYYASPSLFHKIVTAIQDCIPARLKAFHIVNEPIYCGLLIKVFKMFMSEKLKKRIYAHGRNLKNVYEQISPEMLPDEIGGTQGPMFKSVEALKEKFLLYEDHFVKMNKYGYRGETLEKLRKS